LTRVMATSGLGTDNRAKNHPPLKFVEKSFPTGAQAVMTRIISAVPRNARRPLRLTAEMNKPAVSEKRRVVNNTWIIRQNSPAVTPPRKNDKASMGIAANNE